MSDITWEICLEINHNFTFQSVLKAFLEPCKSHVDFARPPDLSTTERRLSLVIEKPLIARFFNVGRYGLAEVKTHCALHRFGHSIQPNFDLRIEENKYFCMFQISSGFVTFPLQSHKPCMFICSPSLAIIAFAIYKSDKIVN